MIAHLRPPPLLAWTSGIGYSTADHAHPEDSMTRSFLACGLAALMSGVAFAQEAERPVIRLWDGPAPLAKGESEKDVPTLTVYRPAADKANGCAMVICPGGGYGSLAVDHEGKQVGEWLSSLGVTAFELHYRLAPYRHPVPLIDVQRAIRTVRAKADEFEIDPRRVGILGFSAGGHLASTAATHFDDRPVEPADAIDRQSARPDFAVLAYPVITFDDATTHAGSKRNLLGENPDPALVRSLSNENAVTKETPPVFLFHTAEDTAVPPENSLLFFAACRRAGVPAELHVFERGRHGVGLAQNDPVLAAWPRLCERWLRMHGWLDGTDE
ncbi:MAG TPA: alpha/beta hydrolase [Planctomycetaceae bacterium]